jgi:hypothetical protein
MTQLGRLVESDDFAALLVSKLFDHEPNMNAFKGIQEGRYMPPALLGENRAIVMLLARIYTLTLGGAMTFTKTHLLAMVGAIGQVLLEVGASQGSQQTVSLADHRRCGNDHCSSLVRASARS